MLDLSQNGWHLIVRYGECTGGHGTRVRLPLEVVPAVGFFTMCVDFCTIVNRLCCFEVRFVMHRRQDVTWPYFEDIVAQVATTTSLALFSGQWGIIVEVRVFFSVWFQITFGGLIFIMVGHVSSVSNLTLQNLYFVTGEVVLWWVTQPLLDLFEVRGLMKAEEWFAETFRLVLLGVVISAVPLLLGPLSVKQWNLFSPVNWLIHFRLGPDSSMSHEGPPSLSGANHLSHICDDGFIREALHEIIHDSILVILHFLRSRKFLLWFDLLFNCR